MQTNEASLVGTTLRNKYYINEVLGADIQGGQGKIYLAKDTTASIEKRYIVKQFSPNYQETSLLEVGKRLFEQEAKILQKLGSHSQIPQILDYFEENKQFFLVQEWINGQNLNQELNSKQRLTESETIALLKDVLGVLSFVHQNDCIHRDIKPANLIRNIYDRKIFIIDFGAVKEKIRPENIDQDGNSTRTIVIKTEGYTPNEQLRGTPEFSSDIYALGMLAIQALTGIHPAQLQLDDHYNPLWHHHISTGVQNFNPNLLAFIDRMVRGHHKERYQTAAQVIEDLEQIHVKERGGDDSTVTDSVLPWIVLGLFISLSAIFAGILFLSNKPQYAAYDNSDYAIELERPENWSIQEEDDLFEPGFILLAPDENNQDNFRERVKVYIENLSKPLSINEYTEQALREIKKSNTIIEQPQDISFANREGRKIIYTGQDGMKRMEVWTIKNQKAYIATYTAEPDKFDKFSKQAEKIIESIKIKI
jgi:eukaryotic-like serine/threonine-protein kinase